MIFHTNFGMSTDNTGFLVKFCATFNLKGFLAKIEQNMDTLYKDCFLRAANHFQKLSLLTQAIKLNRKSNFWCPVTI